MIRQEMGSDPASVAFDTLKSAVANKADVVLIDTAAACTTRSADERADQDPQRDGQGYPQRPAGGDAGAGRFDRTERLRTGPAIHPATQVTSLTITKLDGTAKGAW